MRGKQRTNMKPIPITEQYYQEWIAELAEQLDIPIQDAKALLDEELQARGIKILPEL